MWGFSAHGSSSSVGGVSPALNGGGSSTPNSSKDPASSSSGFGYPPTPPIDLKSVPDNQQHLHSVSHQDYLHQHTVGYFAYFSDTKFMIGKIFAFFQKTMLNLSQIRHNWTVLMTVFMHSKFFHRFLFHGKNMLCQNYRP